MPIACVCFVRLAAARRQNFVQLLMEDSELRNQLFETHLKKVHTLAHASQFDLAQSRPHLQGSVPFSLLIPFYSHSPSLCRCVTVVDC